MAVRETLPALAVIVTGVDVLTPLVGIAKLAVVDPCATDTLAGTVAAVLLLDSETASPPAGAVAVRATVPSAGVPPVTLDGLTDTAAGVGGVAGGVTVSSAVREMPLAEAVMVVVWVVGTARVDTGKVPLDSPPWTTIVVGTVAAAVFELDNETTSPPAGAPTERKTVPVAPAPPWTVAGERPARPARPAAVAA